MEATRDMTSNYLFILLYIHGMPSMAFKAYTWYRIVDMGTKWFIGYVIEFVIMVSLPLQSCLGLASASLAKRLHHIFRAGLLHS